MPLLINLEQSTDSSLSVMFRTGVLYHGTPGDSWMIYGGMCHRQMVDMIQAPMYQLVSRNCRDLRMLGDVGEALSRYDGSRWSLPHAGEPWPSLYSSLQATFLLRSQARYMGPAPSLGWCED